MSRIGRAPITIPAGVEVKVDENNHVIVKGPKGTLEMDIAPIIEIEIDGAVINVKRPNDEKDSRSLHGLSRTLISNMVVGVSEGFTKTLTVNGVGYRAAKEGNKLVLTVGFSHLVTVEEEPGISIEVPNANTIVISGIDKHHVGQFAADVRSKRPPEPYKGKGIKYSDEIVRLKEGKTGGK